MDRLIRDVFESECGHVENNLPAIVKKLQHYQISFTQKNADHIAFFGGNLMGVNPVRFMPADRNRWFDEILQVDEPALEQRLLALPDVNEEFNVSSDTMNLSCAWLCHAIYQAKNLDAHQKHLGMMDTMLIMQYKFTTSLLYRYFKYPAQRAVAEATYAELSGKFALKQAGSWTRYFELRSEDIISKGGIHFNAIAKMDNDIEVIKMLNDVQGRIRDMMKNIYGVFLRVHQSGIRVNTSSAVTEHDGEKILKDKTKSLSQYTRYLNEVVTDKNSFIHQELVLVIEKLVHTAPPVLINGCLAWISDNYQKTGHGLIESVMSECLIHSFGYFDEHRAYVRGTPNLGNLLERLKGVYMSSRSTDPILMSLRVNTEDLVFRATQNKNQAVVASVRTAVLLYLVARALTMTHYST